MDDWDEFRVRAKAFFDTTYSPEVKTRTALYSPTTAILSSLTVIPDWERGLFSEDEESDYLEFPLISDINFGSGAPDGSPDDVLLTERRLLVRGNRTTGEFEMYTALWVPKTDYDQAIMSGLTLFDRSDFSGRVYLFYPDGQFFWGKYCEEGRWTSLSTITEPSLTRFNPESSKGCEVYFDGYWEQTCWHGSQGQFYGCSEWEMVLTSVDIVCGDDDGGGGGPFGGGGGPPGIPDLPPAEEKPEKAEDDCDAASNAIRKLMGDLTNLIKGIVPDGTNIGFSDFVDAVKDSKYEHGSVYYNSDGKHTLSPLQTDNSTSSVNLSLRPGAIATLHNHPSGFPPSITDIMGAGKMAGLCPGYKGSLIYDSNTGGFYIIGIEDAKKAAAFTSDYESQIDSSTNWFKISSEIDKYLKDKNDFSKMGNIFEQIYQLADILKKFDSGMRLIEIKPDGSTVAYDVKQELGNIYKTPTKCEDK